MNASEVDFKALAQTGQKILEELTVGVSLVGLIGAPLVLMVNLVTRPFATFSAVVLAMAQGLVGILFRLARSKPQ